MVISGHARLNDGETVLKLTLGNDKVDNDERAFLAWVPEHTLQAKDPEAVYQYWESLPGGRDYQLGYVHQWAANRRLGRHEQHNVKWEIFRVSKFRVRKRETELLVHWQGYREEESSWVLERDIDQQSPEAVTSFWKEHIKSAKVAPRKRTRRR
ncbi:chromo domain-containing protein [Colletotrichum graminicola M1.001]|uniref:Chromo domain-containing protein n=1 Tax=Colletotrichum graminicola (strain M1.001 / M2 / FGSC 10212) TaxID=645133 RepID=E3QZR4_COLGM|nr:chromo domain-containing protein [Colletotrichum graminicola M1.001]EFQ36352.1 chromo domain-containing protein [Colletotrichum graminicola M1.001]